MLILLSHVVIVLYAVLLMQGSGSGEGGGGGDKSSLQRYFEREINAVQDMLKMLRRDLAALKLVAEGEERSTNRTRDIQAALLKGEVPSIWLKYPVPPMPGAALNYFFHTHCDTGACTINRPLITMHD